MTVRLLVFAPFFLPQLFSVTFALHGHILFQNVQETWVGLTLATLIKKQA